MRSRIEERVNPYETEVTPGNWKNCIEYKIGAFAAFIYFGYLLFFK